MANAIAGYLKKTINPGGSPRRMKEWLGAMLLLQVFITILPGSTFNTLTVADMLILSATVVLVTVIWSMVKEAHQVHLCWVLFFAGIAFHIAGALWYHSNRSDFVMITSWGIAMFINERRFYISFGSFLYAVLMVTFTITVITFVTYSQPLSHAANNVPLMCLGMATVTCNIYLLLVDFRHGKHRQDYFERDFEKIDEITGSLSRILMADKPVEQVMWDVTRECIPALGLEDFVIYLYDKDKNRLVQVAAYGPKSNPESPIINPLEIAPGQGIVGKVFASRKPILVADLSKVSDYIVDDALRSSELAVPILIGDSVFGVIDSEHYQKGFYRQTHLQLFNVIAAFCSIKIAQNELRAQQIEAETNRLEVAKMKELEQLKTRFITNISHDLKTPLSLILGPANQVFKTSKDEFTRRQVSYIIKNTDHLMQMVEQLLQLNIIEQGMDIINPETTGIAVLLHEITQQYVLLAEERHIDLTVAVDEDVLLTTDSYKLSQSVHNLLQNAFRHTPDNGKIMVRACMVGADQISISVKDTGTGIAAEEQNHIFDRFYKIDVNNHKGTGIGLSLVKEFVGHLKGSVVVKSAPGAGAEFIITIPIHLEVKTNEGQHQELIHHSDNNEHDGLPLVLIAEDHTELNAFIAQSLQQEGYRCLQAYNGREALRLVEQYMPDIIVSDLMMPEMPGEELVTAIRESENIAHIPIVILTAKSQVDNRIELYQSGADNYISKPFKMDELLAVIDTTLKQRMRLRESFYTRYMHTAIHPATPAPDNLNEAGVSVNKVVQQCRDYVLQHLDDPDLNVNSLGTFMAMGRNKLQREIKLATSLTPVEFIRSIRLHEARKLLQNSSQYNVSEVAYMTGFSNLSYFSRSFKAQFGSAPTEVVRENTL